MFQHCTVCGGPLVPHFPEVCDPLTNEIFSIYKCTQCGLGHTLPKPQELSKYYGSQYYGNRHSFMRRRSNKRRLGFVASAMGPGSGRRLLDIGCGDGSFLLAARDAGWDVMGTELDPKPALDSSLDVRKGIELIFDEDYFDCITMWHTLEHMPDIKLALAQIAKVLKPDGKLLIAVPDNGGYQAKVFRHRWFHLDAPRHLIHFDVNSLEYCLRSAGFSSGRLWHQEFEYDLLGWSQSALNYILPYPNVFFNLLTGKQRNCTRLISAFSLGLGAVLTLLSIPALVIGTALHRGGTIVVAAGLAQEV